MADVGSAVLGIGVTVPTCVLDDAELCCCGGVGSGIGAPCHPDAAGAPGVYVRGPIASAARCVSIILMSTESLVRSFRCLMGMLRPIP